MGGPRCRSPCARALFWHLRYRPRPRGPRPAGAEISAEDCRIIAALVSHRNRIGAGAGFCGSKGHAQALRTRGGLRPAGRRPSAKMSAASLSVLLPQQARSYSRCKPSVATLAEARPPLPGFQDAAFCRIGRRSALRISSRAGRKNARIACRLACGGSMP